MKDAAAQLAERILAELEKDWLPPYGREERDVVAKLIRFYTPALSKTKGSAKVTRSKSARRRD
jgi:hypothetical protein